MTSSTPKQETPRTDAEWKRATENRWDKNGGVDWLTAANAMHELCEEFERALSASRQGEVDLSEVIKALKAGPEKAWSDHGPERGQDRYYPAEDYAQFHRRIVGLLETALASRSSAPAEDSINAAPQAGQSGRDKVVTSAPTDTATPSQEGHAAGLAVAAPSSESAPEELVKLLERLDQERSHAAEQYGVMDLRIEDYDKLKRHLSRPAADREDARQKDGKHG